MTLETVNDQAGKGQPDLATSDSPAKPDAKPKSDKKNRKKRQAKPADVWLKSLLAPHSASLKRKSWLESFSGILAIAQAACLAFGMGALIEHGAGFSGLLPYAVGLLLVICVRAGLNYYAGLLGHKVSSDIRYKLRHLLAKSLANQSPLDIQRRSAGEIAALGSDVIETLDPYTSRYLSLKFQLMIVPLAIIVAAASISWAAALVLLICGPLIPVFMAIIGIRAKKASDKQVAALSDMSSRFLDRLSGMTTLRLYRSVHHTRTLFADITNDYRQATMRVLRIAFLSSAALELFAMVGIALIAIYVGYHYLGESDFGSYGASLTLSTGLFLLLIAPEFFSPLREFSAAYHDKAAASSAADRLRLVIDLDDLDDAEYAPSYSQIYENALATPLEGEVTAPSSFRFDECAYGYQPDRAPILKNVSFSVEKGQSVALVGASGSGKSTLLAALCGFLHSDSGTFAINGDPPPEDQDGWDRLRKSMAWIGQKPHIFHGSLLKNARLAAPYADREQVNEALKIAHADRFVQQLPRDLLTVLGETGFGISGGQVRRLAIARAALSDTSMILCDEPTADLDADSASMVRDSLMNLAEGRTMVIATHDEAVAEKCDRIFHVRDGSVVEISKADLPALYADETETGDAS